MSFNHAECKAGKTGNAGNAVELKHAACGFDACRQCSETGMKHIVSKHAALSVIAAVLAFAFAVTAFGCSKSSGSNASGGSNGSAGAKSVPAERIVCLSPSGAEILFAIGAGNKIVARTDFCDYPERIAIVPSVGGFSADTISVESILSYEPDFVYGSAGMHDQLVSMLKDLGVKVYLSSASSIDDVLNEISDIGAITGCTSESSKLVASMKKDLTNIVSRNVGKVNKPSVYYETWNMPYMSVGKTSFISDIIDAAGGVNIFADLNEAYPQVSEEAIIARKPDVIILPESGASVQDVAVRSGWEFIPAVQMDKVYVIDDDLFSRPGPRIVDAIRQLNKLLYEDEHM